MQPDDYFHKLQLDAEKLQHPTKRVGDPPVPKLMRAQALSCKGCGKTFTVNNWNNLKNSRFGGGPMD